MLEQNAHQAQLQKKSFYNYKLFVIFSIGFLVFSIGILLNSYLTTGDFLQRGIELKGGSVISIPASGPVDIKLVEERLSEFPQLSVRQINGISGSEISIETSSDTDPQKILDEIKDIARTEKASVRSVGSSLGSSFFFQVQVGLIASFILMATVVFVMFRSFAPSVAVILAAVSDIIETMAVMNLLGIQLTLATFAALLMLVGYSVDTDMLLGSRVLKGSSSIPISERIKGAFKTGMTMNITTIAALLILFFSNLSPVLTQIASVLIIGIVLDMINTWIQNVAIIRRYAESKGL